jgi:simple sugar transport system permease protein
MSNGLVISLILGGISYGTPLLLAGLGELLNERGGVLNVGIEGMMLVGAACGFWIVQVLPGPSWLVLLVGVLGAGAAGACMAAIFAVVCLTFRANQVVAGLALAIFGGAAGLSSYLAGKGDLVGTAGRHLFGNLDVAGLGKLPFVGPVLFDQNALVYLSWALTIAAAIYLYRTRWGLNLRAVGEDPASADAMGINVLGYRYVHTIVGGVLAGVAGSAYSLDLIPSWSNGLTAGVGWVALGLVIVAFWRPGLLVVGCYLFGIIISLGFTLQARGVNLPPELFSALPYLSTVIVLVLTSGLLHGRRLGAPAALGRPYVRGR